MKSLGLPLMGKENLSPFIPHRGNMLLIDGIISVGDSGLTAHATLDDSSPFFSDGGTPGYVSFELIAQAVSVYSHVMEYAGNDGPSIGFILRVTDFIISRPFLNKDECVMIEIEQETDLFNGLFSFKGKVFNDAGIIAQGRLLVMSVDDVNRVLKLEEYNG